MPPMTALAVVAGAALAVIGGVAERIASVWPPDEASRRGPGWRTVALALAAGVAGWAVAARSTLPLWATLVHLGVLCLLLASAFLAREVSLSLRSFDEEIDLELGRNR